MAGSSRKFSYTSDDGNEYNIFRDESNTEALNENAELPTGGNSLPDYYEPRYALLVATENSAIRRKITILSPETFQSLNGSTSYNLAVVGAEPLAFKISSLIGEKRMRLINADTGQDDGDDDAEEE